MDRSWLVVTALVLTLTACDFGIGLGQATASCRGPALAIAAVQGVEAESALVGEVVTVEGVVAAHPSANQQRSGFFLQALTPDADPRSSEGLFVATGPQHSPPVGRRVRARGEVRELEGMTVLHAPELIQECGEAALAPLHVTLAEGELGRLDGMLVQLDETLTLIDTFGLLRSGELSASRGGRLFARGHALGSSEQSDRERRWLIEDPELRPALEEGAGSVARLRLGDEIRAPTGVVYFAAGRPGLLATEPLDWREPPLPTLRAAPPDTLRIVSLNLANYFVRLGSRGAASEAELSRQRIKLVAALVRLDADLVALTELENDGDDASLRHLLALLDEQLPAERRYTWSRATPPGDSALRAGLIYRPGRVQALGGARFELRGPFTRPPLVQSFEGQRGAFTLVVVHLKSKRCDGAPAVLGPEGCNAEKRLEEAGALGSMASLMGAAPGSSVLLLGDFNSDSGEAPMLELRRAGWVDLLDTVAEEERYSYVFEGHASLLDHALGMPAVAAALRGASIWHINADEPRFRSHHLDNPPEQYRPDPFRCSDHDPVVLDLEL